MPHPKAHGILFLYGITADEAQLAIFDSRSVLQEQDKYQVPSTVHEISQKEMVIGHLTSYLKLTKLKYQVEGSGT